jgi:NTE family protein
MIGAIYAAGHSPAEIEQRLTQIDHTRLYTRKPGDGPSLLGLGGVTRELFYYLKDSTFRDLRVPFACTAVDLEKAEEVYLTYGNVLDAVLATIAIPGIFPPKLWEGRLMVDGGLLDPVPVALARTLAPRLPVIAVVLTPHAAGSNNQQHAARFLGSFPFGSRLAQMRWAQSLDIFMKSMDVAGCYLANLRLQIDHPEVVIRPSVEGYGLMDKFNPGEVIRLGEKAAEAVLPQLKQLDGWRTQLSQRLPWLSDFFVH